MRSTRETSSLSRSISHLLWKGWTRCKSFALCVACQYALKVFFFDFHQLFCMMWIQTYGTLSLLPYIRTWFDNKWIFVFMCIMHLVSGRRNLNINSHFISCPCGLYINTKVCLVIFYLKWQNTLGGPLLLTFIPRGLQILPKKSIMLKPNNTIFMCEISK